MNGFNIKNDPGLKETYYYKTLSNGMKLTVVPKDFSTAVAVLCCDFGGEDSEYSIGDERFSLPAGTAHFLEHKMFENPDGSDAFSEFDRFGGNANAFTSYENTCYYFSCTENFFENLEILLSAVSGLYITDASVDKERKIIEREIAMYEDHPPTAVSRNLTRAMYHNSPTLMPIAGTTGSVAEIDKNALMRAYGHFYVPTNLSLCVCGRIDGELVAQAAERFFKRRGERPKTLIKKEPRAIVSVRIEEKGIVATPLFLIGIKCPIPEHDDQAARRRAAAIRLAISLTFGRAGSFYCDNYAKGLLSERFYAGYVQNEHTAHIIVSGSTEQPEAIYEAAINELEAKRKTGFTEQELIREKRAAFAEMLTLFDSGDDLAFAMAASAFNSYDEYDCIHMISDITLDELNSALADIDLGNSALSIITKQEDNRL